MSNLPFPIISIPPELLVEIFPFHLAFDRNLKILQVGKVIERINPEPLLDRSLTDNFSIIRPTLSKIEFDSIKKRSRSRFLLKSCASDISLRGQMIYLEESDLIFFLCHLWIVDKSELSSLSLKLKDFPAHDPIMDFLFLLQAKDKAFMEIQELLGKLDRQKNELQATLTEKEQLAELAKAQSYQLQAALDELQQAQMNLIQTEKMSGLGQLVAGVAHEINNPINFIHANLKYLKDYSDDLTKIIKLYQQEYPNPSNEIKEVVESTDLEFLLEDLSDILKSMKFGTDRIQQIVKSLNTFSQHDRAEYKFTDIHEGIESTLHILNSRLKAKDKNSAIQIHKDYAGLPKVECYPSQLNQVFMNILVNAIDAVEERDAQRSLEEINSHPSSIRISTELLENQQIAIRIADNGSGIVEAKQARIFEPFYTTKPVGRGTGLGLSISYQIIVEKHKGTLTCNSTVGQGTEFTIQIPLQFSKKGTGNRE